MSPGRMAFVVMGLWERWAGQECGIWQEARRRAGDETKSRIVNSRLGKEIVICSHEMKKM